MKFPIIGALETKLTQLFKRIMECTQDMLPFPLPIPAWKPGLTGALNIPCVGECLLYFILNFLMFLILLSISWLFCKISIHSCWSKYSKLVSFPIVGVQSSGSKKVSGKWQEHWILERAFMCITKTELGHGFVSH